VQRKQAGDEIAPEWIGTEKQVLARLYLVCDTKEALAERLHYYMIMCRPWTRRGKTCSCRLQRGKGPSAVRRG
jgi:hypothetical protein